MRQRILQKMEQKEYRPLSAEDLAAVLHLGEEELPDYFKALRELEREGTILLSRKKRYGLCHHMGLVRGRIEGKSGGYAFLIPDDREHSDLFIAADDLHGALHNDMVLARVVREQHFVNGKDEAEVVRILAHANERIIGVFREEVFGGTVYPDDKRISRTVAVPKSRCGGANDGDVVLCEISSRFDRRGPLKGSVKEIIGRENRPGIDMEKVIHRYHLAEAFPPEVLAAAAKIGEPDEADLKDRVDLRGECIVTIDGEDARDFDDAVSLTMKENGHFLLGVHIADVAHYVAVGSPLDREAYRRGTGVYLPDRVLPMLPEALSDDICSLRPGVDRLTLSCRMEIDQKGRVVDYELFESVIRSVRRMTYTEVNAVLDGDGEKREKYGALCDLFFKLDALRAILCKKRKNRGALAFCFAEAKAVIGDDGEVLDIVKRDHGRAEGLIEECMIAANETVAAHCFYRDLPLIYRVHDRPDDEKILELAEQIAPFGYGLGCRGENVRSYHFSRLLEKIEDRPERGLLEMLILRTLSHAVYSTENRGHFGLASDCYCHFTSPIRRYPDLCVHRVVKASLGMSRDLRGEKEGRLPRRLEDAARQSSICEVNAEDAEREALDAKMALYMAAHLDEEFNGVIAGVAAYGFFVELANTVNGLVNLSSLEKDDYEYHPHAKTLLGKKSRVCFRLGDAVRIRVSRVNVEERLIDFDFISFLEQE